MWDAVSVLEAIDSLKHSVERLSVALEESDYDWGTPVSDALETAIKDEATLAEWVSERLSARGGNEDA